jgi:carbonic anhydrase
MSVLPELLAANQRYADAFAAGDLPSRPSRRLAVLTCMDARLDPPRFLGLQDGDAHVIRNAGAHATEDAIRSLIVSYTVGGTREFLIINHTDCGLHNATNQQLREHLRNDLGADASAIDFLPISDLDQSVREDVERLRACPYFPPDLPVSGFIYDVRTGRLRQVVGAATERADGR